MLKQYTIKKIIVCIILLLILIISMLLSSCAISGSEQINLEEFYSIDVNEYNEVLSVAESYNMPEDFDFENIVGGYPLYWFTSYGKELVDRLLEQMSFSSQLRDWHGWFLITDNNKKIYLLKPEEEWDVYRLSEVYCDTVSAGIIDLKSSYYNILKIKNQGITNICFAHEEGTGTQFVIITTKEDEYVIPFFNNPKKTTLEDGKLYTSKEMIYEMQRWY